MYTLTPWNFGRLLWKSLISKDMIHRKILETGTLRPEIAATPFPQLERLNRTINQTPVREIPLR